MKFYTYVFFNACFHAMLTILLYDLTFPPISDVIQSSVLKQLIDYYKNRSILQVSLYSFVQYAIIILISISLSFFTLGFLNPTNSTQIIASILVSSLVSFFYSIISRKVTNETDLEEYNDNPIADVSTAFRTAIGCIYSYIAQKYMLPMLI